MANVTWPIYNNIEFVAATTSTDFYVDCASWLWWLCLDKPVHRAHLPSWNGVLSLCAWSPSLMLFQLQMRYNSLVHDPLGQQDQPGQPTNETFDRRKCDSRHNQVFSSFFFLLTWLATKCVSICAGHHKRTSASCIVIYVLIVARLIIFAPKHGIGREHGREWVRARARFLALHHHRLIYSFMTAAAHVGVPLLLSYNNNKNNNAIHKPRKKQSQKKCAIRLPIVDL